MGSAVIFTVYYRMLIFTVYEIFILQYNFFPSVNIEPFSAGIVAFDRATRNYTKDDINYWVMGSAGIFGTYPAEHMRGWIFAGFYDQVSILFMIVEYTSQST